MKLYHGSKLRINDPINHGSKEYNDYGPAFYLTRDLESAKQWSCRNNSIGYVNSYNLNDNNLKVLDLTDKNHYSVLNWLAILLRNRELPSSFVRQFSNRIQFIEKNYYIDVNDYDVVIGYRADDAYFRFPIDFVIGNITLEQLEDSFMLGEMGIQVVIMSQKGIDQLTFVDAVLSEERYIGKYFENVNQATKKYDDLPRDIQGTYITDLMKKK